MVNVRQTLQEPVPSLELQDCLSILYVLQLQVRTSNYSKWMDIQRGRAKEE